jgi:hypothetical protein
VQKIRLEQWGTHKSYYWVWIDQALIAGVEKTPDGTWRALGSNSPDDTYSELREAVARDLVLRWDDDFI